MHFFQYHHRLPYQRSLKRVAECYLKLSIQKDSHDSKETAKAVMPLIKKKISLASFRQIKVLSVCTHVCNKNFFKISYTICNFIKSILFLKYFILY